MAPKCLFRRGGVFGSVTINISKRVFVWGPKFGNFRLAYSIPEINADAMEYMEERRLYATSMGSSEDGRFMEASCPIYFTEFIKLISGEIAGADVRDPLLELGSQVTLNNILTSGILPGGLWSIASCLRAVLFFSTKSKTI